MFLFIRVKRILQLHMFNVIQYTKIQIECLDMWQRSLMEARETNHD